MRIRKDSTAKEANVSPFFFPPVFFSFVVMIVIFKLAEVAVIKWRVVWSGRGVRK